MIKAEWTNADALDLQLTCNQVATDCISRQDAIMHFVKASEKYECGMFSLAEVTHELWKIASAQPDRKTGEWILTQDDDYECCTCSVCGYQNGENWMNGSDIPFCVMCGADMRGEQDDSD